MTTITRENLIQMLQDDPMLVEDLRSLLFTRELLTLPQTFAKFAETVDKQFEAINRRFETIDKQFEAINRRFDAIDKQFEAINRRFDAIDKQFEAINRRFETIDKQFEAINRRFETIDKQFEAINRRFDAIDKQFEAINRRFETIDKRFDVLESDVNQLKIDVSYLKGKSLETELPGRVRSRVEHRFNIRRSRVVRASTQYLPMHDFEDAVYDASIEGILTASQRQRILDTDLIVQGRSTDTGKDAYVAVESSFTIHDSDVVKANRTASALKKVFPDADVWAAVYCAAISDENSQRAKDDGVEVISNARL